MSSEIIPLDASAHPVKAVTIFQSSLAQLTRTFVVELKSGSSVLEISRISRNIDAESPRIHSLGTDAHVVDISCNPKRHRASRQYRSRTAATIKRLEEKRRLLNAERKVHEAEWDALNLAAMSARDTSSSFDELMSTFITRKRNAIQAVIEMRKRIEEVDEEIMLLKDSHKGKTSAVVTVTLFTKVDCKVEFQLTYLVTGVTWKPYYDLHGITADGKPSSDISLHFSAIISQNTGEDWTNTILVLSAADSHTLHSLAVPEVSSLRLLPQAARSKSILGTTAPPAQNNTHDQPYHEDEPMRPVVAASVPRSMMLYRDVSQRSLSDVYRPALSPPYSVSDEEFKDDVNIVNFNALGDSAALDKMPLSNAYRVEGRVSLPAMGRRARYICVPRKTSAVFIEGQLKNTSGYELPTGPMSVFMDGSFVTKTSLGYIAVDEPFTCVLGVDTSLKVSYQTKSRTEREPTQSLAEPSKTTTRTVTTTITNGHSFDIAGLVVRDAIPLGNDDANFQVTVRRPDGLLQAKDGDEVSVALSPSSAGDSEEEQEARVRWVQTEHGDRGEKEGLYEWVCDLKAGKKVRLEAEWEIKARGDVQWEEMLNV